MKANSSQDKMGSSGYGVRKFSTNVKSNGLSRKASPGSAGGVSFKSRP